MKQKMVRRSASIHEKSEWKNACWISFIYYNIALSGQNRTGWNNYVMGILSLTKKIIGNTTIRLKIITRYADNYILCGRIHENLKISYKKCKFENINRFFWIVWCRVNVLVNKKEISLEDILRYVKIKENK